MINALLSIITAFSVSSHAHAEELPLMVLDCTNGAKIVFYETQTQDGLGVLNNEIDFSGQKIKIDLVNTYSGRRIINGKVDQMDFQLTELADAPYWSLEQAVNRVSTPPFGVKCYRDYSANYPNSP